MSDAFISTDLGHQTAQRIVHASDPLQSMQEISQNFPSVVSSLSLMKVFFMLWIQKLYIYIFKGIEEIPNSFSSPYLPQDSKPGGQLSKAVL